MWHDVPSNTFERQFPWGEQPRYSIHPRAHAVKLAWEGWPCEKNPAPVLSCLSSHSDPIVLETFDVTLWYSGVPRTPNFLKISSDVEIDFRNDFFSTLRTGLMLNRISMTIINKVGQMAIPVARQSQDCIRQHGIPSCRGPNLEIGTIPRCRTTADRCMIPLNYHLRSSSCYHKFVVVSILSGMTCSALFCRLLDSTKFSC